MPTLSLLVFTAVQTLSISTLVLQSEYPDDTNDDCDDGFLMSEYLPPSAVDVQNWVGNGRVDIKYPILKRPCSRHIILLLPHVLLEGSPKKLSLTLAGQCSVENAQSLCSQCGPRIQEMEMTLVYPGGGECPLILHCTRASS